MTSILRLCATIVPVVLLASLPGRAAAFDAQRVLHHCTLKPREFMVFLIRDRHIANRPDKIDQAVSVFNIRPDKPLTMHGMPVAAVFGFAENSVLFEKDPEEAPAIHFGALFNLPLAEVNRRWPQPRNPRVSIYAFGEKQTAVVCNLTPG